MTTNRRNPISMTCLLALLMWGLSLVVALGAPVLGTDNFDNGLPGGWTSSGPDGIANIVPGGVNPGGNYYQLQFDSTPVPVEQVEYIYNGDANHIGNYAPTVVNFSFYVSPVSAPAVALNVYFRSSSGTVWYNEFTVPANDWTSVSVNFSGTGWYTSGSTDFLTDVTDITRIGIQVHHFNNNGSSFTYGLDNWTVSIPVPEPENIALMAAVVFSLLLTFRQPLLARCRRKDLRAI